jgi:uncharacterized protein involved in exopolysaccharide biosynthesis
VHDPDTFDVRGSLLTVYRTALLEWRVILVAAAVVLAVTTAYIIWWPPVYQAEAVLMSEGDRDAARDSFYGSWSIFRKDDMRTEAELFLSAPVLKEVVEREKLTYDEIYHSVPAHLGYLWQKSLVGRTYRGFKDWLWPPEGGKLTPEQEDRQRVLGDIRSGFALNSVGESNMGVLVVRGPTRRVADVANTLIDVYLNERIERYKFESMRSIEALDVEIGKAEQALRAVEAEKIEFMRVNDLGLGVEKEKLEVTKLADLEERAAETRAKIASNEASLAEIDRQLASEPATRTVTTSFEMNSLRETAKAKRLDQQAALVFARSRYREDSPEVQDILSNIAGLDRIIAETSDKVAKSSTDMLNTAREELVTRRNMLRTDLAGLKGSLAAMERRRAQLKGRMVGLPVLEATVARFDREHKLASDKYLNLTGKRAQAAVSLAGLKAMPSMRVVSPAKMPDRKNWPKPIILYPVALVFGLALGLALALVKTIVLGRIRREQLAPGRGQARFYGLVGVPTAVPRIAIAMPERLAPPKPS